MSRCRNSYTEQELKPLTLEALGRLCAEESADYQHFLQDCVDSLFKEVKEKFKGWVSCSTSEQAELSYKKVGHPSVASQLSCRGQGLASFATRPCYPHSSAWGPGTHALPCRAGRPGDSDPQVRAETSPGRNTCQRNQTARAILLPSTGSHQSARGLLLVVSGLGLVEPAWIFP